MFCRRNNHPPLLQTTQETTPKAEHLRDGKAVSYDARLTSMVTFLCSALRVGSIINYVMGIEGHFGAWQSWARRPHNENCPDITKTDCGASSNRRGWSAVKSSGDVDHDRDNFASWSLMMASALDPASAYIPVFKELAAWMKNAKAICSLSFVLAFHGVWRDREIIFCHGWCDTTGHGGKRVLGFDVETGQA
jgi:hypothetical protein